MNSTSPNHTLPSPRTFHVVIKAVGSRCNLDCTYCYYLGKQDRLGTAPIERMSDELLELFLREHIAGQELDLVRFNWHGGEPTLLGVDFFRRAVAIQQECAGTKRIENEIQTNGVLIDDAWCELLKEHCFVVGLSLDGPRHLHDQFRRDKGGQPTFDRVYRAARLLQKYEIPFNTLTVVNRANASQPDEVYHFLADELGVERLQWLPCVATTDYRDTAPGRWNPMRMPVLGSPEARPGRPGAVVTDWSVDPDEWGEFLCRTFDLWLKKGLGKVFINWFESFVGQWMGRPAQICTLSGVCGRSLVTLDVDGSLYSCDHFVFPEYRLGRLGESGRALADAVYSDRQREFGTAKHATLPDYCRRCPYVFACNGECPKNRILRTPDGQPGLNYLCSGNRRFFSHADPYLRQIAARLQGSGTTEARL